MGAESDWINMGGECAACDVYATFPKDSQGYCPKNICFASYHITYSTSCPAHAQPIGNPCTCDDPYVPDPTKTSCVLDQYSLSLQISPGQVEPSKSAKIIAKVIDTLTGQPKEGVTVGIKVDVDVTSGGHVHGESEAPRGKGTLIPATGTTLADGTVSFTFGAPEVSGKHSFTAQCDNPTCTNNPITAEIKVMVDGLSTIPGDPSLYVLIGGEEGKKHHDNHYLTDDAKSQLVVLAINYHFLYPNQPVLHLNDASLEWGGLFDFTGNWKPGHHEHKRGTVIDIRANEATGAVPFNNFDRFEKIALDAQINADIHCTSDKIDHQGRKAPDCIGLDGSQDSNRHYHIRLMGVAE